MLRIDVNQSGLRHALAEQAGRPRQGKGFRTGLEPLDAFAPAGVFRLGAVHELLSAPQHPFPNSVAMLLATAAQRHDGGCVVWSDPTREVYPPALAAGLPLHRLMLLRPRCALDELRMLVECLRCTGVVAVVAAVRRLSRVQARQLQLAAERGGGIALLLRPFDARSTVHYAAATRWLVRPAPGSEDTQCWSVELVHGHGGRVGESVLLEMDRETGTIHAMHSPAALADRSTAAAAGRASA